ncbi:NAD(P)H-hydrate epimerase [Ceratocystis fimbriata CBS 114723]|uniref:NAD(P)H-hydrate epimerase n=1 Tax=Ceratocystis fimbriata CBS 114723 TaxID=1035309 RepID=A0A2C5XA91_9PEZI|nr:NAD(P)H-hydrate epimerase [Ceratocystis fimbriata CBS 114723]
MTLKTLGAKAAAALDAELMSSGAFSIDQLMELAGLAVSQAIFKVHPISKGPRVLVAVGPGNNGGDGLVAARHLHMYGYTPTVYYPKRPSNELYQRLTKQLQDLSIPFSNDFSDALGSADHVVDAIFGFSFSGPVREPFRSVISQLASTSVPVTSIDAPSSWDIHSGPPPAGNLGCDFHPATLVSLTAPKPLVRMFKGRHFIGGRFVGREVAERYGFEVPPYQGLEQVVEIDEAGRRVEN